MNTCKGCDRTKDFTGKYDLIAVKPPGEPEEYWCSMTCRSKFISKTETKLPVETGIDTSK